jgi:hypothetical protein
VPTPDVRARIRQAANRVREGRRIPFAAYAPLADWLDAAAGRLDRIAETGENPAHYVDELLVWFADSIERACAFREEYEAAARAADPNENHRAALVEILDMPLDSSWPEVLTDVRDQLHEAYRGQWTGAPGPATPSPEVWPAGTGRPVPTATTTGTGRGAVTDAHTGWNCPNGASLLASAEGPGRGALPAHHGVIYVCPDHQAEAEARITAAGHQPNTDPAPPGHRRDPWPCGHITTYGSDRGRTLADALTKPTGTTGDDPCA